MPALFVSYHREPTVFLQFPRLDRTILKINPTSKALESREILAMQLLIKFRATETSTEARLRRSQ